MTRPLAFLQFTLALGALTLAAHAQTSGVSRPAKAAERQAAIHSIQAQLQAFGRDDYKTAIGFQSSGLKKNFASPGDFRAMMVHAYPEFAHYKSVSFGPAQADPAGAHLEILAAVTGKDGVTVHAMYLMVREGKVYRVEGVAGGSAPSLNEDSGPTKDV